jgi:hypothetical protein
VGSMKIKVIVVGLCLLSACEYAPTTVVNQCKQKPCQVKMRTEMSTLSCPESVEVNGDTLPLLLMATSMDDNCYYHNDDDSIAILIKPTGDTVAKEN